MKAKPDLSHSQQVTRLYRHSLKLLASWAIDHEIIGEEARKIRDEFDANRHLEPNSGYVKSRVLESLDLSTYV